MTELKKIQEAIQNYIQKGDGAAFDEVTDGAQLASKRLQIYRDSYFLRLIQQLGTDYPKLALHLGQVAFGGLVHEYMTAVPSRHYSIHELGRKLPVFMDQQLKYPREWTVLAYMEAALSVVILIEKEPILTLLTLNRLTPDEWAVYYFKLIKAHQIVLFHPVMTHYFNLDQVEVKAEVEAGSVLIWQKQDKVFYEKLSGNDAYLINYFKQGLDFTLVCEKMSQHLSEEQGVSFIFQRIQYWLNQEIFSDH